MNYQQKYIKYKNKYLELKNNRLYGGLYGGNAENYQQIIYKMAKYLKPDVAYKFKNKYGLKQLANKVLGLNKYTFIYDLQNVINDYYITDKIDGKRTVLYLTNNNSYAVNDTLTNININTKDICILDTEMYNDNYYVFDVMVYNNKILINIPFEERITYFNNFANLNNIKIKSFIKLNNKSYKKQIYEFKNENKSYDVDGIIFVPYDGLYNTMKVYKYKPFDKLTIDFYIKKCPVGLGDLMNTSTKDQTLYLLFCGISKNMFFKLRMNFTEHYNDIFPNINTKNLPQYFPIQFSPGDQHNVYRFWSNDTHLDNEIGEFLYDIHNHKWILDKIRNDRKIEVTRGNYFGNDYKVAESIWMSYSDPLVIESTEI